MELKDVIHFYLGCEVQTKYGIRKRLIEFNIETNGGTLEDKKHSDCGYSLSEFKPILRQLTDMTDNEKILGDLHNSPPFEIDEFTYLLKHGFDLFGLIESGQAIDKTTLK